ncbi:hypothetical protein GW17_00037591 [Ensete ventricosum]|nr:hypothetical protein GW17_00037591 [Ensete ventricosum]
MGNALGGRKKAAKIMKIDGTTFKVKPPAQAITVLRDHPGHALFESDEVKCLALRARPLDPEAQLQRGKLYFLVELTQLRGRGAPRRAWSGQLQVGAKERLESLRLTRRSMSDLSLTGRCSVDAEEAKDGAVRLRVRLPKVQVEKLMQDSRDAAEAANKIMQLCVEKDGVRQRLLQPMAGHRREVRHLPLPAFASTFLALSSKPSRSPMMTASSSRSALPSSAFGIVLFDLLGHYIFNVNSHCWSHLLPAKSASYYLLSSPPYFPS